MPANKTVQQIFIAYIHTRCFIYKYSHCRSWNWFRTLELAIEVDVGEVNHRGQRLPNFLCIQPALAPEIHPRNTSALSKRRTKVTRMHGLCLTQVIEAYVVRVWRLIGCKVCLGVILSNPELSMECDAVDRAWERRTSTGFTSGVGEWASEHVHIWCCKHIGECQVTTMPSWKLKGIAIGNSNRQLVTRCFLDDTAKAINDLCSNGG